MPHEQRAFGAGAILADRRHHAIMRTWRGRRALCGAGRIIIVLGGRFDGRDVLACPSCAAGVRSDSSESGAE
jgi:hypothetical protein